MGDILDKVMHTKCLIKHLGRLTSYIYSVTLQMTCCACMTVAESCVNLSKSVDLTTYVVNKHLGAKGEALDSPSSSEARGKGACSKVSPLVT